MIAGTHLGWSVAALSAMLALAGVRAFAAIDGTSAPVATTVSTSSLDMTRYTRADLGVADVRFNALIQGWAVLNQNTTPHDQNLRLRRAELTLKGTIARAPRYVLMVDPSRLIPPPNGRPISAEAMLQDMYMSYELKGFELTAGQFKIPTTAEGLDSSGDLPLPERSLESRIMGDRRELGIQLAYKTSFFHVRSMVSTGRNVAEPIVSARTPSTFNDLDSRLELTPAKGLSVGTFAVIGNQFDYVRKARWGLNGRYNIGKAQLRAEYATGRDGGVHSQGVTTEVGYWITGNLFPVARFETFSPAQSFEPSAKAETIGVNYYFRNYFTKLQVAGSLLQDMASFNGSPTVVRGVNNQEVTLQLQASI